MSEAINQEGKIHYYNCIELREGREREGRKKEEGRMQRWIKMEENDWDWRWEGAEGRQRCWDEVKDGGRAMMSTGGRKDGS